MKDDINQIPLNYKYIWQYYVCPDECEDAGPTLVYINMPETMSERMQLYMQFGEEADFWYCERCFNPQYH